MAKKISNESFVDSNFGQPVIDALQEILKLTDELTTNLKKVGKESEQALEGLNPMESVKDSNKLNETLEKLLKTQEEITKLQQSKIKIENDLKKLQDQQIKQDKAALDIAVKTNKVKQEEQKTLLAEQKLQAQILRNTIAETKERERQTKIREREAKQREKQNSLYAQESQRLNELRKRYKELAIAEEESGDEAKELLSDIIKLDKRLKEIDDTVGQNQRSVGNYKEAIEDLKDSLKTGFAAGPLLAIGAVLGGLGQAFGDTREGALELQVFFSRFTETAKVFIQSVINSGEGVRQLGSTIGDSFVEGLTKAEIQLVKFQRSFQSALSFIGVDEADEEIQKLDKELVELNKTLEEAQQSNFSDAFEKIGEAFEGTVDTTSKAIEEQEKFLRLQLQIRISIQEQERALAGLAERRQILQDISDDDTLGFIERAKFVREAQKAAFEFAEQEERLALDRERLTIEAIKQDLRRAQVLDETRLEQIKTGEQLQAILRDEAAARKVSDENDEAFSQAFIDRVNKQVEAEAFRRDQEEKNRKTARDGFEQDVDIFEEFAEKRIAANQKIIDDETKSIEQRQAALRENQKLEEELFQETIDRIIKQGQASIQLRKDLSDAEKQRRIDLLATADIQKIVNAETETERLQLIRALDLGEIETNRLKESIKINQDLAQARRESGKALEETATRTEELQEEILLQERKLAGEEINLSEERIELQKKQLQERIDLLEEDSIKRLELEKELNELKLEEQAKAQEEETQKTEEEAQKRADAIKAASQLLNDFLEKQGQERLDKIDSQLSAIEERQSSLRAAAERGNEEAVKSLAESEKQEAQIRAEKEKELQRQQRIEAGLAAFQVFSANAQEDPNTALSKTLTDITALTAFIGSLPSFFVGTEDTGTVNNALDSNGGRLSILHDNERVLNKKNNTEIKKAGIKSNEELTRLAVDAKRGTFRQFENVSPSNASIIVQEQESIKSDIQQLIKEVKKNRPIDPIYEFDQRTGELSKAYKAGSTRQKVNKTLFHPRKSKS